MGLANKIKCTVGSIICGHLNLCFHYTVDVLKILIVTGTAGCEFLSGQNVQTESFSKKKKKICLMTMSFRAVAKNRLCL